MCRPIEYMDKQRDINPKMRSILIDWILEVHHKFELMPETLYLTTYIIDRYLSLEGVARRQLQLVGMCAMLIACKYEEIWAPEVKKETLFFFSVLFKYCWSIFKSSSKILKLRYCFCAGE